MHFVKFVGVGGVATLLQYAILILLVETSVAVPAVASTIGFIISGMCNYLLNYYFTFGSNAKHQVAATKFVMVASAGLTLNTTAVYLLTERLAIYYIFAQALATLIVLLWNFFAHKHWTYKSVSGT